MFFKKKIFYIILMIVCIAAFSVITISALDSSKYQTPPHAEPETEQPNTAAQAEIDPYDKTVYENEIVSYTDVILPLNDSNADVYLGETLFVGDSNTEGIGAFEHLPMQNVLGKHSMSIQGFTADDYLMIAEDNPETEEDESQYITMLQVLANTQPKRIIINFGTNNAGKDASTDYFSYMYSQALMQIKTVCPNTQIVVAAVLPVCSERANYNLRQDVIDSFNISLAELCRSYGYGFLNYNEVFKDTETGYADTAYFSSDGIHLNKSGYRLLLDYAANHQYN